MLGMLLMDWRTRVRVFLLLQSEDEGAGVPVTKVRPLFH